MKKFLAVTLSMTMLAGVGAASAQPPRYDDRDRNDRRYESRGPSPKASPRAHEVHQNRAERRAERRYAAARYQPPRGVQYRRYRAGERLPPQYRERVYIVDHRRYALAPPPRGYQYVRVGNDVALSGTSNGVIASLIIDLFR